MDKDRLMTLLPYSKTVNVGKLAEEIAVILDGSGLTFSIESADGVLEGITLSDEPSPELKLEIDAAVDAHEPITLAEAKKSRIASIRLARREYLFTYYELDERLALGNLAFDAFATGKTNRSAYIKPASAWAISVMAYCAQVEAAVNAQASIDAVNAVPFDIAANTGAVPVVTVNGALAIAD